MDHATGRLGASVAVISRPAAVWLTSGDSEAWSGPYRMRQVDDGPGPRRGATYVLLVSWPTRPDEDPFRVVAVDRHRQRWVLPRPGRSREVGIWFGPQALAGWTGGTFTPPRPEPGSWCTLCATEQEARAIAERTRTAARRGGW